MLKCKKYIHCPITDAFGFSRSAFTINDSFIIFYKDSPCETSSDSSGKTDAGEKDAVGKVLTIAHGVLRALATPIETVMIPILALDLFGEKSFTKTLAVTSSVFTIGQALNSPIANLSYDIAGNYRFSFLVSTVISLAIIILINLSVSALKRKNKELH